MFLDFVYQEDRCSYNNTHMKINPFITAFYNQTKRHLSIKGKDFLTTKPTMRICSILLSIILIIILIIMIGFYIRKNSRINELEAELEIKNKIILEEQMKNNQTIQIDNSLKIQMKDFQKEIGMSSLRI